MSNKISVGSATCGALLGIHAQTSLHAGAGTALGTVDLPVQRERHTHWPMIAGSALKGILRDACREKLKAKYADDPETDAPTARKTRREKANADPTLTEVFGPPTANASDYAGALAVTDARLLAFPVRSLKGVFALVTCPLALERLVRDAALVGSQDVPWDGKVNPEPSRVIAFEGASTFVEETTQPGKKEKRVVLAEFDFTPLQNLMDLKLPKWLADHLLPDATHYASTREGLAKRLLVLHDDDFTHFARHATEVTARIGLDYDTKTVKDGALFYQEFLPAETLMYAVVLAHPSRRDKGADASAILDTVQSSLPPVLQIGGDETTGKGLCSVRLSRPNIKTSGGEP